MILSTTVSTQTRRLRATPLDVDFCRQPHSARPAGHILTVQSNQFCAVQKAECAVQVAKLCSPKYVLWTFTQINYKSYLLICCICRGGRRELATCLSYKRDFWRNAAQVHFLCPSCVSLRTVYRHLLNQHLLTLSDFYTKARNCMSSDNLEPVWWQTLLFVNRRIALWLCCVWKTLHIEKVGRGQWTYWNWCYCFRLHDLLATIRFPANVCCK